MNKKTLTKTIIVVCTLLFCAALLVVYFTTVAPPKKAGSKTVSLTISYSDAKFDYNELVTEKETVFELLKEYDEKLSLGLSYDDTAYGALIKSLKGTENDAVAGFYYRFLINGQVSQFGASSAAIKDGDAILFEYGYTTYDPKDWSFVSFELKPSSADSPKKSESLIYRSAEQTAVAVVMAIIAAASIAAVVVFSIKNAKKA